MKPLSPLNALLFISLFSFSFLFSLLQALVIRVPSGKVKCVTEDVDPAAMSLATYRVVAAAADAPYHHNMSARVTDPNGDTIHLAEDVDSGQFVFTAKTAPGPYSICFWSPVFRLGGEIEVDFEWKTGINAAQGFRQVTKKGKIDAVETDLRSLEDSVNSIYMEMRILRQREEEAWKMNDETNLRMGMLSLLSLVICLGVAGVQMCHLKTFFEREKIL